MNCIVTSLSEVNRGVQSEQEIPELDLPEAIIEESKLPRLQGNLATNRITLGSTRSGRVFKPQKFKQQELTKQHYPG